MRGLRCALILLAFFAGPARAAEADPDPHRSGAGAIEAADGHEPDIAVHKANWVPTEYRPFRDIRWEHLDFCVLVLLLANGVRMVLRKSRMRWLFLQSLFSLFYLGFFRGGCLCPIGATADVSRALVWPEQVGRITLFLFLMPLVAALIAGRVFCGSVCPLGALQDVVHRGSRPRRVPPGLDRVLRVLPVLVLVATAWLAVRGGCLLVCRLDPFVTAFAYGEAAIRGLLSRGGIVFSEPVGVMVGDAAAWSFLCAALLLSMFVAFPFCRYVCPYGVLLGLFSLCAFRRRQMPSAECTRCTACERSCPVQAIAVDREAGTAGLDHYACIQCGRCTEACKRDRGPA